MSAIERLRSALFDPYGKEAAAENARLRAQLDKAREALHRLSHYHSSPALHDVPQTTKQVRIIAKKALAEIEKDRI